MHDPNDRHEVAGQIKWFDTVKGFGFILDALGGVDILLHANVLRNFGQGTVAEGTQVRVLAVPTARGMQAVEVLEVVPPTAGLAAPIADLIGSEMALETLDFQPARIKWFDKAKGFGFANVFGQSGDVFLHIEVLRHGGLADLAVGEAIAVKVVEGRRGPMAAQVAGWDLTLHVGKTALSMVAGTAADAATAGEAAASADDQGWSVQGQLPRLVAAPC